MERPHFSRFGLLLLALLTLGWGFNWPIMKIVLHDVPPLTFRGVCLLIGGLGVLLIARAAGQSLAVPVRYRSRILTLALCNSLGWNIFAIYGVGFLSSGRAALLGYTMPLWSTLFSVWLLRDRLTSHRIMALFLGMAGIVVLMSSDIGKLSGAPIGVALMLAAAFSWGLGIVLLKRFAIPIPTVTLTGWTMLAAGLPVALAALLLEHDQWRPIGTHSALGILYNVFIAFMFCYWAWNRLVLMVPVAVSSLSSLVTPVVGVLSGMWLLDEQLSWHEIVAGALILCAITIVVRAPQPVRSAKPVDVPLV